MTNWISWQNMVIPYQRALLRVFAGHENTSVKLVLDREFTEQGTQVGWRPRTLEQVDILVAPDAGTIRDLVNVRESIQVFCGLHGASRVVTDGLTAIIDHISPIRWLHHSLSCHASERKKQRQ